jgi:cytochrome c biogenesis protein CcmG, thiol:disulfide interchange protein DsbE
VRRTAARLFVLSGLLLGLAGASGAAQDVHLATWTGGPTPSLALKDSDGRLHDLTDYRGKVLLVNFWATWCAPCKKELAMFDRWNSEWNGRGARIVAVSIDKDARKAKRFADEMALSLTLLHDGPDGLARSLDLPSVPCTYLLDRDGKVVSVVRTSTPEDLKALKGKVESMLTSHKTPPQAAGMGSASGTPLNPNGDSR